MTEQSRPAFALGDPQHYTQTEGAMTSAERPHDPPKEHYLDGRFMRSERTRRLMIKAYLQLVREHDRMPTAKEIARQSGYALRSIFERFSNLDGLLLAAVDYAIASSREDMSAFDGSADRSRRIAGYIRARAKICEDWLFLSRTLNAFVLQSHNVELAARLASMREDNVGWLERACQSELDGQPAERRRALLATLSALTGFESWHQMRHSFGFSFQEAEETWGLAINRLLRG